MNALELYVYFTLFLFIFIGIISINIIISAVRSNRLVVRRPTSGNSFIENIYWVIPKINKQDGSVWWVSVFWQKRVRIQEPPNKVMDVTRRGKKWVEVYRLSEDEYVFCKDAGLNAKVILEEDNQKFLNAFQPFSVVQRETIFNQYKKANAEKPADRINQIISMIPMMILGMVVIVAIIYSGEIAQSINNVQGGASGMIDRAAALYRDTKTGVQDLTPEVSGGIAQAGEVPPR